MSENQNEQQASSEPMINPVLLEIWRKLKSGEIPFRQGDFVRSKSMPVCCGLVISAAIVKGWQGTHLSGYSIQKADGQEDFIEVGDCEFIAPKESSLE